MNLICELKGHEWVFQRNNENGGIYRGSWESRELVFPSKEYKCSRCGVEQIGTCVTKSDHDQVMAIAQLAQGQTEYDRMMLPAKVSMLEKRIEELEKKE